MAETGSTGPTEADAEQSATRALCGVLDLPGLAAAASAVLAPPLGKAMLALVAPLDTIKNAAGLGRRLLDVASSNAARDELTISDIVAGASDRSPQRGATATPPPPWPSIIGDLIADLIEDHTPGSPDAREAQRVLREIGQVVVDLQSFAVTGPSSRQLPEETVRRTTQEIIKRLTKLKKLMEKLEKFFPSLTAPRFRKALLAQTELWATAPNRAVIAAFMAVPGFLVDLAVGAGSQAREVPSNIDLGNEADDYLQKRYRSHWVSPRFVGRSPTPFARGPVVQDGMVYQNAILGIPSPMPRSRPRTARSTRY